MEDQALLDRTMTRRRFLVLGGSALLATVLSGCLKDNRTVTDADTVNVTPVSPGAPVTATATAAPTTSPTRAASRCPRGLINDPYPGSCRHYIDSNHNGLCDYSEVGE